MQTSERAEAKPIAQLIPPLLFVAEGPVSVEQLAKLLEVESEEIEQALSDVETWLSQGGLALQRHSNRLQIVTASQAAPYIERLLGLDLSNRLSPAALEVLAIIAYRQPITRAEIEAIRGVSSDSVIRSLTAKGLIGELGRLEQAGRPIVYGTTFEFLQYFGLGRVQDLPPLPTAKASSSDDTPPPQPAEEG